MNRHLLHYVNATLLALLCTLFVSLTACAPIRHPADTTYTVIDALPAWNACLARCAQNDELGLRTRTGCRDGCELALDAAPLRDTLFLDSATCVTEMQAISLDELEQNLTATCRERTNHLYKRKGCLDAVRIFARQWRPQLCVIRGDELVPAKQQNAL